MIVYIRNNIIFCGSILIILFFSVYLFSAPTLFAQSVGIGANSINLGLSPSNPGPNQTVTATIESFSINLESSKISWVVNGKIVSEGIGYKQANFLTSSLGKVTSLSVIIHSSFGDYTKNITINPASVDLVWEAQTYTPPFYKGKALFSPQSTIRIVSFPHIIASNGKQVPKEDLVYTWSQDGTVLGDSNGYGKYILPLTGSVISRPFEITLTVHDTTTGISAFSSISIEPTDPRILLYIHDPLYGTQYKTALQGSIPLTNREITLDAVPYFFSTPYGVQNLSYIWSINNTQIDDNENTLRRVFRTDGKTFGVSNISVSITNIQKILQFNSTGIRIDFQKDANASANF